MTELATQLDSILADPLVGVRGRDALGYVGMDIPPDLLLAVDRPACHLPWRVDMATPRAGEWLEHGFAGWARSIVEQWAEGAFDGLRQVVFTRGDDSSQRLYYYVCELQRRGLLAGPRPLIFDVARIARESSRRHTVAALRRLSGYLGVDESGLRRGIERANRMRQLYAAIVAERDGPGHVYEQIGRASLHADLGELLRNGLNGTTPTAPRGRALLAGSAPPDGRLHAAIEQVGWWVVDEAHERSLRRWGSEVEPGQDAFTAVAHSWLQMQFGVRDELDQGATIVAAARRARADVVVLWLTREDEALAWHVPAQRQALHGAGIPCLLLGARSWDAGDGAADEIGQFLGGHGR